MLSGVPGPKRDRRLMMTIQAFIDDSKTDGEVLILAGYLASSKQWEKFSVEWQQLLDGPPRWERFKMAEIAGTRDQQRWERAAAFCRVVETYAAAFVAVAVELGPLMQAARDAGIVDAERQAGLPKGTLTNPYIFAHRAILDATLQYQTKLGIDEPVDFIFDEFGNKRVIAAGWDMFAGTRPPELQRLIGREPRFESDDEFLPLQAADMLAWHAREHWLKHRSLSSGGPLLLSWKPKNNPPGYAFNFGYLDLLDWFKGARVRGIQAGVLPGMTIKITFSCDLSDPEPPV